ncbi:hypothetical protein LOK49_LG11G02354 [Camellia lanceoleosa]|uniref:Uncharacterized protein n=1 Tax=Camellia lanceoleosa TaxID=1840588 RepID=A0ACC0FZW5_9ERIC|nr:hypothetical protein LOK49_LG11G02354 [Camellia lanceoleosa]
MEELAELERLQARLLHRITEFELSHLPQHFSDSLSVPSPPETPNAAPIAAAAATEARLSAILRSNGVRDFSFKQVLRLLRFWCRSPTRHTRWLFHRSSLQKHCPVRLAPEETSLKLTGFGHNAVTCIGMNTDIRTMLGHLGLEVILDEAITKLNPDFFWLGGGEVFLKLGIRTSEFINFVRPFIVSCSSTT